MFLVFIFAWGLWFRDFVFSHFCVLSVMYGDILCAECAAMFFAQTSGKVGDLRATVQDNRVGWNVSNLDGGETRKLSYPKPRNWVSSHVHVDKGARTEKALERADVAVRNLDGRSGNVKTTFSRVSKNDELQKAKDDRIVYLLSEKNRIVGEVETNIAQGGNMDKQTRKELKKSLKEWKHEVEKAGGTWVKVPSKVYDFLNRKKVN